MVPWSSHEQRTAATSSANGATAIGVTTRREIFEVKRTLDGKTVAYRAVPLLVEPGVRAALLYRLDEPEVVAGGRMTLAPGTVSVGYFWCDRPYTVYHWLYGRETLAHYINIGRFVSVDDESLVWDDYAVDVLAYPDGRVDVVDQDEMPSDAGASTRRFINEAAAAVLTDVDAIVAEANAETANLLTDAVDVVRH